MGVCIYAVAPGMKLIFRGTVKLTYGCLFMPQLNSIYEGKSQVSRAKMASITKAAIKAVKFYKHVVQSVEKFIQKVILPCRVIY
jgi:hypothetical protein